MRHPEEDVLRYARGEEVGNPEPLDRHLAKCERCNDMFVVVKKLTTALREEGQRAKERPSIEDVLKEAGFDGETAREILLQHFYVAPKRRRADYKIRSLYLRYLNDLCFNQIFDPRGNRVRFFPSAFVRLAHIKNKWGQTPKDHNTFLKKITGIDTFHHRGGDRDLVDSKQLEENLKTTARGLKDLKWAKLIASEPTWIFRELTCSPKVGTEAYVKNCGTNDDPDYRVLICKVNGAHRDVVTLFPRKQIGSRELRNRVWPPIQV